MTQRLLRNGFAFAASSPFFATTRWFFGGETVLFVVEAIRRNALSIISRIVELLIANTDFANYSSS